MLNSSPRRVRMLALAAASGVSALFLTAPSTRAVDVDWDNSSLDGQWETPANWSNDAVPAEPNDAVFINPAAGPAIIDNDITTIPRDIRFGSEGNRVGSGTVNHSAGNLTMGNTGLGWMRMGLSSGSGGTYNLSGGMISGGRFNIAESGGSTGTLAVTGGTLRQNDTDVDNADTWSRIGQDGAATFNVSDGLVSFHTRTIFGAGGAAVATITQTGGTVETRVGQIDIGDTGDATYTISGGTLRKGGTHGDGFVVGQWTGSNGILNVSATANVISEARLIVGHGDPGAGANTAVGIVNQDGGTVTVTDQLQLGQNVSGNGTYNLNGGTLDMTGSPIEIGAGTGLFNFNGGRLVNVSSTDFPLVQTGGTLAPGAAGATGTTTITGDYSLAAAGTYEVNLEPGGASDMLAVSGAATLAGNLDVIAPAGLTAGQTFLILTPGTLAGEFANAPGGVLNDSGYTFMVSYIAGDGNDVALIVVPEPAALGLIGLAAGGLLLRRRRHA